MKLDLLFTIRANLGVTSPIGDGGRGTRAIAEVTGGTFEGERLRGEVLTVQVALQLEDSESGGCSLLCCC